jgi:AcrR family transcriptional regulator
LRPQVVDAAVKVVKGGGQEQMTIGGLAGEMGAAPMSLYRYVRDRDDLLDEVVDRLLVKRLAATRWRGRLAGVVAEAADKLRRFLVAQPAGRHVYLRHPAVSPAAIAHMQAVLIVVGRAGFDTEATRSAYPAIHTYTVGFAAVEASRAGWVASDDTGGMPNQTLAYTTPRQSAEGLHYPVEGIEQRHRPGRQQPETTRTDQGDVGPW